MSKARADLDWNKMFELAIDSEKAIRYRKESTPEHEDSCTMSRKMCPMNICFIKNIRDCSKNNDFA